MIAWHCSAGLGLGVKRPKDVASPSFVILKIYPGRRVLYHFDLYRLKGCQEALDAGLEEFMNADGVAAIEWAEVARASLPRERLDIRFSVVGETERRLKFIAVAGSRWKRWRVALTGRSSR
jgi:tRNA threonylcarbamoyladenosine biosynthesis protein TsaE